MTAKGYNLVTALQAATEGYAEIKQLISIVKSQQSRYIQNSRLSIMARVISNHLVTKAILICRINRIF